MVGSGSYSLIVTNTTNNCKDTAMVNVIVGDTHQQIYSWRYAINSLEKTSFKNFNLYSHDNSESIRVVFRAGERGLGFN